MTARSPATLVLVLALSTSCQGGPGRPAAGELDAIPDRPVVPMDAAMASRFVALSLSCVDREFPNKPGHVYYAADEVRPPREVTPAFFGCFDWHSAVHGHWAMVRLLKRFPNLPEGARIREILLRHLSVDAVQREVAFLYQERSATFERPYGLAWVLQLAAELTTWDDPDGRTLAGAVAPLARAAAKRIADYLPRLTVPIRDGTHSNTAFALALALDWSRVTGDATLADRIVTRARDFYLPDRDCPLPYEPSGEDFLSPCLAEADLMRRVLPAGELAAWLDGFLPRIGSDRFRTLRSPVEVRDPKDPRLGHLIGLSFHRAWALRGIALALPDGDLRRAPFQKLSALYRAEGLRQMFDAGYGGEHWLASFATYLMTGDGG